MSEGRDRRTIAARSVVVTQVNVIAGSAGQYVVIDGIVLTASAAGTLKLVNSDDHGDVLPALDLPANGHIEIGKNMLTDAFRSAVNQGLDVTITGSGSITYIISYHYEP